MLALLGGLKCKSIPFSQEKHISDNYCIFETID